jgi:hypothetical protein
MACSSETMGQSRSVARLLQHKLVALRRRKRASVLALAGRRLGSVRHFSPRIFDQLEEVHTWAKTSHHRHVTCLACEIVT